MSGRAALRDQLQAMEQIVQRQRVVSAVNTNQDVIAFARENNDACVQIFFIRSGKIIGREYYVLEGDSRGGSRADRRRLHQAILREGD